MHLFRHIITTFIRGCGEVVIVGPHFALAHDGFKGFLLAVRRILVFLQQAFDHHTHFRTGGGTAKKTSIVKVNATHLFFEGDFEWGVAFSLTKRCV